MRADTTSVIACLMAVGAIVPEVAAMPQFITSVTVQLSRTGDIHFTHTTSATAATVTEYAESFQFGEPNKIDINPNKGRFHGAPAKKLETGPSLAAGVDIAAGPGIEASAGETTTTDSESDGASSSFGISGSITADLTGTGMQIAKAIVHHIYEHIKNWIHRHHHHWHETYDDTDDMDDDATFDQFVQTLYKRALSEMDSGVSAQASGNGTVAPTAIDSGNGESGVSIAAEILRHIYDHIKNWVHKHFHHNAVAANEEGFVEEDESLDDYVQQLYEDALQYLNNAAAADAAADAAAAPAAAQ